MKNIESNNLGILGYSFQELTLDEQQFINGGSGITRAAGWLVGAIAGGCADVYNAITFISDNSCD